MLSAALVVFLSACQSGGEGEDLFGTVAARDADFTVIFPPAVTDAPAADFPADAPASSADIPEGAVVCAGEKRGDVLTLTVLSPERSAGVILTLTRGLPGEFSLALTPPDAPGKNPGNVQGGGWEEEIRPAPAASRALTDPFALLWGDRDLPPLPGDPEPGGTEAILPTLLPVRREGEELLLTGSRGTLVLNADGLPIRAVAKDLAGNWRTIRFENYTVKK